MRVDRHAQQTQNQRLWFDSLTQGTSSRFPPADHLGFACGLELYSVYLRVVPCVHTSLGQDGFT